LNKSLILTDRKYLIFNYSFVTLCLHRAEAVVSIPAGETKTFEFKPINGRYVNIIIPGRNEHLTLCEVEVFAGEQ